MIDNNPKSQRGRLSDALIALSLALLCAGCGKSAPSILEVEGCVFLDGRPLNNVEVRFIPTLAQGSEYMAKGITDKEGKFTLTCKGQAGACAGDNHVLIMEAEIPAHLKSEKAQMALANYLQSLGGRPLPERYTDLVNNPLVVNVNSDQKEYNLELTRGP
jgi:hypothetical protein